MTLMKFVASQRNCSRDHIGRRSGWSTTKGRPRLARVGRVVVASVMITTLLTAVAVVGIGVRPAAAAGAGWSGLPTYLPLPSGQTLSYVTGVSCTSATACIAVGYGGSSTPVAETLSGSTWTATNLPLPSGQTSASLEGVSCTTATACVAVGTGNYFYPVAETLSGTTWTATNLPLPPGQTQTELTGVSCTSATACVAVGETGNSNPTPPTPVAETLSGTTWTATNLPLPSGLTLADLSGVSCTTATACVAVGSSYYYRAPIAETLSGTTWTAANLPLPSGQTAAYLARVSCTSATACVAVGWSPPTNTPIAETLSGTTWSGVGLPVAPGSQGSWFGGISCTSVTACVAVGTGNNDAPIAYLSPPFSVTPQGTNPGADTRGGGGGAGAACNCATGEPVNPMNGDYYDTETDLTIPGAGIPLTFNRTYDSIAAQAEANSLAPAGPLGYGWSDNLSMSVAYSGGIATVTQANGSQLAFKYYATGATEPVGPTGVTWCPSIVGAGIWCPTSPRYIATLSGATGGTGGPWTFVNDVKSPITYSFTTAGVLSQITDATGDTLTGATYTAGSGQTACPSGDTCTGWSSTPAGETTPSAVLVEAFNSLSQLVSVFFDAASGASSTQQATFAYTDTGCSTWGVMPADLCSVTDPGSLKTTFAYDTGKATPFQYDETSMSRPGAGQVSNTYTSGQITKQVIGTGATNQEQDFSYATSSLVTNGTETTVKSYPNGTSGTSTTTTYLYSNNVEVGLTNGTGATTYVNRDSATLLAGNTVDGDGNVSSQNFANYASSGGTPTSTADVTSTADAVGNTTQTLYTSHNLPYCSVDAAEYSSGIRCPSPPVIPTTPPTTATGYTTTIYNATDQVAFSTDPLGDTTANSYTPAGTGVPAGLLYCSVDPVSYAKGITCPVWGSPSVAGTTSHTFDANGDTLTSTDPDGHVTTSVYASPANPGRPTSTTAPDGTTTTFTYNAAGQTTEQLVTFGTGPGSYSAATLFAYDTSGRKYCEVAPYEAALGITCPTSVPSVPPTGTPNYTDTIYDAGGQVTSTTNPIGGTTVSAYDGKGNKYCTVGPIPYARGVRCPTSLPLTTPTTASDLYLGATIATFDADGRVVQETNPLGGITLTAFDGAGNPTQSTIESNDSVNAPNVVTNTTYDPDNRVIATTVNQSANDTQTATTNKSYDPNGNVYCSASPNVSTPGSPNYTCPAWQPPWISTIPTAASLYTGSPALAKNVTLSFSDSAGRLRQSTNPDGAASLTSYDRDGRSTCSIDPTNAASGAACPLTPLTTPPTTATGYTTTIYDWAGLTLSTTDQLANTTILAYDGAGSKSSSTDPNGKVTRYCSYGDTTTCATAAPIGGGSGSMLYSTTTPATSADPAGMTTTDTYWPGGSPETVTTPAGTTTTTPDAAGDPLSSAYVAAGGYVPPPNVINLHYPDRSKAITWDGTGTTTYLYDDAGDVTSKALVARSGSGLSNQTIGYHYFTTTTLAGVVYPGYAGVTNPTATYTYNPNSQMSSVTDWQGNRVIFAHDQDGNLTWQGNESSSNAPYGTSGTLTTYDPADLSSQATTYFSGTSSAIQPATSTKLGTATKGTPTKGTPTPSLSTMAKDVGITGGETKMTPATSIPKSPGSSSPPRTVSSSPTPQASSGSSQTTCTPTLYQLTRSMGAPNGSRNPDGQITADASSVTDNCGNGYGSTTSFGYDTGSKVTYQGPTPNAPPNIGYDGAGHLTQLTTNLYPANSYAQVPDANGEVVSQTPEPGSGGTASTYAYNTIGARISSTSGSTTTTYGSDQLGRMTNLTTAVGSTSYTYDANGLEASVTPSTQSTPTQLTWGATGSLPMLMGDTADDFVYGPSETPVEQMNVTSSPPTSNPTFLNYSGTNGPSNYLITTTQGTYTNSYGYDAYGNLFNIGNTPGSVFGFAGQYQDTSSNPSGFTNMRARWYDNQTGSFTSVDPMLAQTGQPYSYAGNDPVNQTDPSGLLTVGVCGGVAGEFLPFAGFGGGANACVFLGGPSLIGPANLAVSETVSKSGAGVAVGANAQAGFQISDAKEPHQLAGWFTEVSATISVAEYGGSIGVFWGHDNAGSLILGANVDYAPGADLGYVWWQTDTWVQEAHLGALASATVGAIASTIHWPSGDEQRAIMSAAKVVYDRFDGGGEVGACGIA
jgi:RHS repeat-associated protein